MIGFAKCSVREPIGQGHGPSQRRKTPLRTRWPWQLLEKQWGLRGNQRPGDLWRPRLFSDCFPSLGNERWPAQQEATGSQASAVRDALVKDDMCLLNCGKAQRRDTVTAISTWTNESVDSYFPSHWI